MEFSSKLIENAVNEISNLPGIGKKTALRLVLHLLKQPKSFSINLSNAISEMRLKVNFCKNCHNISDDETCKICSNPKRDNSTICVVEDIRDVIAIEKTSSFNGIYHVLGGKISPLDGIGPDDLTIEAFGKAFNRLSQYTPNYAFSTWLFKIGRTAPNHRMGCYFG